MAMKCPTCESCEYAQYCGATEIMRKCERHNKKVEQTNEEYMQTCSSDELANTIFRLIVHGTVIRPDREYIKKWLKEKHNEV